MLLMVSASIALHPWHSRQLLCDFRRLPLRSPLSQYRAPAFGEVGGHEPFFLCPKIFPRTSDTRHLRLSAAYRQYPLAGAHAVTSARTRELVPHGVDGVFELRISPFTSYGNCGIDRLGPRPWSLRAILRTFPVRLPAMASLSQ